MPNLYYMNTPPHPFWDFVAGIEDHPMFAQNRQPGPPPQPPRPGAENAQPQAHDGSSEKAKGKQPEANTEDPPEIDPATVRPDRKDMPFRGRGRFGNAFDANDNKEKKDDGEDCHRGKRGCHGRRGGHERGPWGHRGGPPFGPPAFMFGPNFPFGPHGPFGGPRAPGHEEHEGRGPPGGWCGRGGPHRGRFGHHGHGPRSRSPPRGGPFARPEGESGFDLGSFLNKLGDRLGVDLNSAAEGLGLKQPRSTETDFEPRTDIFDTPASYTIHLSLPGAKKSDVGVDWDGEHSVLRIAGVVHRPGVDEELMSRLVVDGRKRETGVFEKAIRLGTPKDPASVNVEGITAKMVDGVLVVRVPKVEKHFEKKEVRVDGSASHSPERPEDTYMNEKDLLFDADEDRDQDMYEAESAPHLPEPTTNAAKTKQAEAEQEQERARDDRSETVGFEHPTAAETLPRYEIDEPTESKLAKEHSHHEDENLSDWEKYGSEDEGEYVKINVD